VTIKVVVTPWRFVKAKEAKRYANVAQN